MTTTRQVCEICGYLLPDEPFEPCSCANRQSPEFYIDACDVVRRGDYIVRAVGEMKIIMTDPHNPDPNFDVVLRHTSDLTCYGITTDDEFNKRCSNEENFYLDSTPWFEVVKVGDDDIYSDPIYGLDEAVALAIEWHEQETERE